MTALLLTLARWCGFAVSLSAVDPVTRDLNRREAEARRRHASVRAIQAERRERVHALLAGSGR